MVWLTIPISIYILRKLGKHFPNGCAYTDLQVERKQHPYSSKDQVKIENDGLSQSVSEL